MSGGWLYRTDGGEAGPIAEDALLRLVRTGTISSSTLIRRDNGTAESPADEALPRAFAKPPPYTGPAPRGGVWTESPQRPWRRFLARLFDIAVVGDAVFVILTALMPADWAEKDAFLETHWGTVLENFAATLLVVPINAASMARFGTTLGKRVFQVRVRKDGAPLRFRAAVRRELTVWTSGLGLGLPIVELIAMAGSYHALKVNGTTGWDSALGLQVACKPLSRLTVFGLIAAGLVLAGLAVIGSTL